MVKRRLSYQAANDTGNCSSSQAVSGNAVESDGSVSGSTSDISSHPLLADQPDVVRREVSAMMAEWNARASDVISGPTDDDGTVQLDVLEVDGDLTCSVMPQVRDLKLGGSDCKCRAEK